VNIGDDSTSPYLRQPLRSLDEVKAERDSRRPKVGTPPQPAAIPVAKPEPAKSEPPRSSNAQDKRPGQRLDKSV
jgi:hypothetical protein